MVTTCRFVHPAKARDPKISSSLGRSILVREVQLSKANDSILDILSPNFTSTRFVQLLNVERKTLEILGSSIDFSAEY